MAEDGANTIGYLITFTKQTSLLGESVTIQANLPKGATREDIAGELKKIGGAYDDRIRLLNTEVLERTGKNLKDMGLVIPGFNEKE